MVKRVWKAARLGELVKWGTGSGGSERTFAGNEPPNKPIDPRIVYPWMVLQIDKRQWRIDCITGNIEIPEPALRRATNTRTSYYAPLESGSSFDIPLTLDLWRKFGTRRENDIDVERILFRQFSYFRVSWTWHILFKLFRQRNEIHIFSAFDQLINKKWKRILLLYARIFIGQRLMDESLNYCDCWRMIAQVKLRNGVYTNPFGRATTVAAQ